MSEGAVTAIFEFMRSVEEASVSPAGGQVSLPPEVLKHYDPVSRSVPIFSPTRSSVALELETSADWFARSGGRPRM